VGIRPERLPVILRKAFPQTPDYSSPNLWFIRQFYMGAEITQFSYNLLEKFLEPKSRSGRLRRS